MLTVVCSPLSIVQAESTPWWQMESGAKRSASQTLDSTRIESVPPPILFGVERADLTENFGVPRSGGRSHEGLDIMTARRTLIISPTDAVVHSTGDGASSGLYVYTYNPGGEVFAYMHLDEIAPGLSRGDLLKAGDLIGYVGNTGNASGGAPHLHFEIRDSVALDPYPRLTGAFSPFQKGVFFSHIVQSLDPVSADTLMATTLSEHRRDLEIIHQFGGPLPDKIVSALGGTPLPTLSAPSNVSLPTILLKNGSTGTDVTALQTFLIAQKTGPASTALASVGATRYFGFLTTNALAEYQKSAGLQSTGLYDTATRDFVAYVQTGTNTEIPVSTPDPTPTPVPTLTTPLTGMPQTDLTDGATGAGVIWLQTFLINKKSGPASTALANVGATGYFGTLTTNALVEYQRLNNITPASGYYGPVTRSVIATQ